MTVRSGGMGSNNLFARKNSMFLYACKNIHSSSADSTKLCKVCLFLYRPPFPPSLFFPIPLGEWSLLLCPPPPSSPFSSFSPVPLFKRYMGLLLLLSPTFPPSHPRLFSLRKKKMKKSLAGHWTKKMDIKIF